jgi:transposase
MKQLNGRISNHFYQPMFGREQVDDRRVISGILHVIKSGCRWCDCPSE